MNRVKKYMATILDVARLAGVSQGTASNVLNRKGNVSSEKIRLVEEAAQKLGFTINEKAKMLRKGSSDSLAVILPNIQFKQYRDFYTSFKVYAERKGYSTELMITNDNPNTELALIQQAKATIKDGVAIVSCLGEQAGENAFQGFEKVCHVERKPNFPAAYYGFDYAQCGRELAQSIRGQGYHNVLLVHGSLRYSNEKEMVDAFSCAVSDAHCNIIEVSTNLLRLSNAVLAIFDEHNYIDAVVTTNLGFAEKIRQISNSLMLAGAVPIYTVSPVFTLPENDYKKYELNYSLLGRQVAEACIAKEKDKKEDHILQNDGYRKWHNIKLEGQMADTLNVLALEGPEASVMKWLARLYEEKTGTKIHISVSSYNEIYDAFVNAENFGLYDIFRIDVTWLSWFAEKILLPLDSIDESILSSSNEYIPALVDRYSKINGRIYALPVTPSAQLLFYRKDLLEDAAIRREYWEKYKTDLSVPKNFKEFNQVAAFFTRSINNSSKVQYGTSLVLGNTGVAATEFLTRYFSRKSHLYSDGGKILLNNEIGIAAMRDLVEVTKYTGQRNVSWWTDAAKTFANGDVAMQIMFSNYGSEVLGYKSKIIDKVGYSIVPGGNPLLGGGSLGIAKNCRYPQDALAFIKWITSDPVASAMAALGSVSPCLKTYDIYEIVDTFPWLELSKECFSLSKTERLPVEDMRPFDERKFLNIIGTIIRSVCSGVIEIEPALDMAQKMIDENFNG